MNTETKNIERTLSTSDLITRAGGIRKSDQAVVFEGGQYNGTASFMEKPLESIPEYEAAVRAEYEIIQTDATFDCAPNDLLVCSSRVAKRMHGGVSRTVKRSPFHMPEEKRVEVGFDEHGQMQYETVPGDWFNLPDVPQTQAKVAIEYGVPKLYVQHPRLLAIKTMVDGYIDFVRDELKNASIYRGKVITTGYQYVWVNHVDPSTIIYNDDVSEVLGPFGLGSIMYPEAMDQLRIGKKVGLCLAGKPGTGKTLFNQLLTSTAEQHGCTTIVIPSGGTIEDLEWAYKVGAQYQVDGKPVVILFEDIEKLGSNNHFRARLLEALDGIASKGQRLTFVTTTNFPEQLDGAIIRPGRIDQLVMMQLPDIISFRKLVEMKLGTMLADDIDWEEAFPHFDGYTQSWIVGSTETVLRAAVWRARGQVDDLKIHTEDLISAAKSYRDQYEMQVRADQRIEKSSLEEATYDLMVKAYNDSVEIEVPLDGIRDITDEVIETRLDGAGINLETESGKEITGNVRTN